VNENIQPDETLQEYNDRVAVTTDYGFGDAVDINSKGQPLDTDYNHSIMAENGSEYTQPEYSTPDEQVDYKQQAIELMAAGYDKVGAKEYANTVNIMRQQALESDDPIVIDTFDTLFHESNKIVKTKLRSEYKAKKAQARENGTLGDLAQEYRDNLRRLSGVVPATRVDDEVRRQLGGWAFDIVESLGEFIYNKTADTIDGGNRTEKAGLEKRYKARQMTDQVTKQHPVATIDMSTVKGLFTDEDLHGWDMPIVVDGVFVGSMLGMGGVGKVAEVGSWYTRGAMTAAGLGAKTGKIATATNTFSKLTHKITTASNLRPLGISANALGGAAFAIDSGATDFNDIIKGATIGVVLPSTIEGAGKVVGKAGKAITTPIDEKVVLKAEKLSGDTAENINKKYIKYLKNTGDYENPTISDGESPSEFVARKKKYERDVINKMSTADKLAVLRKNYDSVSNPVFASEVGHAEGQAKSQAKSQEQFAAITRELFDVEFTEDAGPASIKGAISKQVQALKDSMAGAIQTAKKSLDDYSAGFKKSYEKTKIDEPINIDDILDDHIDSMPDKLFDDITSMGIDKPDLETVADVKELYDIVQGKDIVDSNGNLLDDYLQSIIEESIEPTGIHRFMQYTDIQKLHDWLNDTKGISYMFRHDVTDKQIANNLLKIMQTDSYAPITKVLEPEHIKQLEKVALGSLFLKDGILTERGRINFWSLLRDARSIRAVSKDMVAVKELMRVYAENVGSSRVNPAKGAKGIELGTKGRDDVLSEFRARGIGQVIAMLHQYLPTEDGRSTYIYRHAVKLIEGETVPNTDNILEARLNGLLARSLIDNNTQLRRQGISPATSSAELADLTGSNADSKLYNLQYGDNKVLSHTDDTSSVMTSRKHDSNGKAYLSWFNNDMHVMKLNSKVNKDFESGTSVLDVINSESLKQAYPELGDYVVIKGKGTDVDHFGKVITIDENSKTIVNDLLHEIQHAMNHVDDLIFVGSNPIKHINAVKSILPEFTDTYIKTTVISDPKYSVEVASAMFEKQSPNADWHSLDHSMKIGFVGQLPIIQYYKNPGERLSRLVENNIITEATSTELADAYAQTAHTYVNDIIARIDNDILPEGNIDRLSAIVEQAKKADIAEQQSIAKDYKVEYNPDYNSRQFDIANQALKKLIDDGKDFAMTPDAIKKYLRGHGVTDVHMEDAGINKLIGNNKITPSNLLGKLEGNAVGIEYNIKREYEYLFYDNEYTLATHNADGKPIWPKSLEPKSIDNYTYKDIVLLGDKPTGESTHFEGEENYKSHVILQDATLVNGETTTHILEIQNDLESIKGIPDKEYSKYNNLRDTFNNIVNELSELQQIQPSDALKYNDWADSVDKLEESLGFVQSELNSIPNVNNEILSKSVQELEPLPKQLQESEIKNASHITDTNAFIREGFNVALENAKMSGSKTVSWPVADVLVDRYYSAYLDSKTYANNKKLYKRIYDTQMVKTAKKYARAHGLKMPYKVGDVWVLDIESTVKRTLTPTEKEAKNKARMDRLW